MPVSAVLSDRRSIAVACFVIGVAVGLLIKMPASSSTTITKTDQIAAPATTMASSGAVVSGTVPAAVDSAPSIVVLDPKGPFDLPYADQPVMDQIAKMFTPDILFARTDQTVQFLNDDDALHNVNVTNAETKEQMFNVAIIPENNYEHQFKDEGLYEVHCDIHTTMAAVIVVSASPYAKMADPDGRIEFDGVVPGSYTARVYTGTRRLEVSIDVKAPHTDIAIKN
jgi:plastocyanin